jgi:hypothetical protein
MHTRMKAGAWQGSLALGFVLIATSLPVAADTGHIEWTRQFGSTEFDTANGVAMTTSDSAVPAYVVGQALGPLPGQEHIDLFDAFVRKYDRDGVEIWTRQFGTGSTDVAHGVAAGASEVYVAGWTGSELAGAGSHVGLLDVFLRKYNAVGDEQWTRQFGTVRDDVAFGAGLDSSGVYVAGYENGGVPPDLTPSDAYVRKYDANGNLLWNRAIASSQDDLAYDVRVDATGVYVVGHTNGVLAGQTTAGETDAFLVKYDANGNLQWTRQFGSSAIDNGYGVDTDMSGGSGVYVVGQTYGTLPGQTNAGGIDAYLRKYDANGNHLWTRQFGTSASDRANGIAAEGNDAHVVGTTYGSLPGWTNLGSADGFHRKYDANGNVVWTNQFGTSSSDEANAVVYSILFVAGGTDGTLPGQTSAGSRDAYLTRWGELIDCPNPPCPDRPIGDP